MTTKYDSPESALETGLYYIGFGDDAARKKALDGLPEAVKLQLGWPQNKIVDTYTVISPSGTKVHIGIGQFRDGYDLWLIDPETGLSTRV